MARVEINEPEKASHSDDASLYAPPHDLIDPNHHHHLLPVEYNDYPKGTRLIIIIISLMLSTFLVALDNASTSPYPRSQKFTDLPFFLRQSSPPPSQG